LPTSCTSSADSHTHWFTRRQRRLFVVIASSPAASQPETEGELARLGGQLSIACPLCRVPCSRSARLTALWNRASLGVTTLLCFLIRQLFNFQYHCARLGTRSRCRSAISAGSKLMREAQARNHGTRQHQKGTSATSAAACGSRQGQLTSHTSHMGVRGSRHGLALARLAVHEPTGQYPPSIVDKPLKLRHLIRSPTLPSTKTAKACLQLGLPAGWRGSKTAGGMLGDQGP
jgi:hypothetical protein